MFKRWWWRGAILILSPALGLYAYYSYYQLAAHHLRVDEHFSYDQSNAYKHAIAAADLYYLVATLTQSPQVAARTVISLGRMNEHLEQHTRPDTHRDRTDEIAKDLHNNYVAVLVAAAPNGQSTPLRKQFRTLVTRKILLAHHEDVPMQASQREGNDVNIAWQWFEAQRPQIEARIAAELRR